MLAGCVQDFVILAFSLRRDGRSLGQIAREEIGKRGGRIAALSVLAIMIILLAVVALVVVNALRDSPWGTFTLAATIPIAMLMGVYLRFWRPGRVLEASALGVALLAAAVVGGQAVAASATLAPYFRLSGIALAIAVILYGFAASALPVWLLLAPRDYLSAFLKVGAILALAGGILYVRPTMAMPALTRFTAGDGPVFPGTIFPFCFITIACGAISGFHALIASGTTPKLLMRETARAPRGLRLHAHGVVRRRHGHGGRVRPAARRLLRHQQPGLGGGRHGRAGRHDDLVLGLPARGRTRWSSSPIAWARRRSSIAPVARRRSPWAWPRSSAAPSAATGCCRSGTTSP